MADNKLGERLQVLLLYGNGLVDRLGRIKTYTTNPAVRPQFLSDPQFSKLNAQLVKDFPEAAKGLEKLPGYELMMRNAKVLAEQMEPLFDTLIDCNNWREPARKAVLDVSGSCQILSFKVNASLLTAWLDLFAVFCKIHMLLGEIRDVRLLVAAYGRVKSPADPSYSKAARYLQDYENPVKQLLADFEPLAARLGAILSDLQMTYMKNRSIATLRKDGALSITHKPEDISRPIQDLLRSELHLQHKMTEWLVYGFLVCPDALAVSGSLDFLKFVLSESYVLNLTHGMCFYTHAKFEDVFKAHKNKTLNLPKQARIIKDAATAACSPRAMQERRLWRIYLMQELRNLLLLFTDKPGLIAPKIQILVSALSMAKGEIVLYYDHVSNPPPEKYRPKHWKSEDNQDAETVVELMDLVKHLQHLLLLRRRLVNEYYLEYLSGADLKKMVELKTKTPALGGVVDSRVDAIRADLQAINLPAYLANPAPPEFNFSALRLNAFRVEVALTASSQLTKTQELAAKLSSIVAHSRYVDSIVALVNEDTHTSLRELYFYKSNLLQTLQATLDGPPRLLRHVMVFVAIFADFPALAERTYPEWLPLLGKETSELAETTLHAIARKAASVCDHLAGIYNQLDGQLLPKISHMVIKSTNKDYVVPRNAPVQKKPGYESVYEMRHQIEPIAVAVATMQQLCSALNEFVSIPVYDSLFTPRDFLREELARHFIGFLRKKVLEDPITKQIARPSILEAQLAMYSHVLLQVDNYVELRVPEVLNEIGLHESYLDTIGGYADLDWMGRGEPAPLATSEADSAGGVTGTLRYATLRAPKAQAADPDLNKIEMVQHLFNWYRNFIGTIGQAAASGATQPIYSPNRMAFVAPLNTPNATTRPELYTERSELMALCRIVGPYGIKLLDSELQKYLSKYLGELKQILSSNKAILEEFSKVFYKEDATADAVKKLRDVDAFVARSTTIGTLLSFRQLLRDAMRSVMNENLPFLFRVVHQTFKQYPPNFFQFPQFVPMDQLALDCGVDVGLGDQTLKKLISRATDVESKSRWALLPYMYAAAFGVSSPWLQAVYRPSIEGHVNNAHCLVKCMSELMINFKAMEPDSPNDVNELISHVERFVEVSSIMALRLITAGEQSAKMGVDASSVVILIDLFIDEIPFEKRDFLEACVPYALFRSLYSDIYTVTAQSRAAERSLLKEAVGEVF